MLLSLPAEWYPSKRRADGSMPYFAHIDKTADLHECVAILTAVVFAGTSFNKARSQSPATSQETGIFVHPPPAAGVGNIGFPEPGTSPCCSLHLIHCSIHPSSVKLKVGTTTGKSLVLFSRDVEVLHLSAAHSRYPLSAPVGISSSMEVMDCPSEKRKRP